MAFLKSKIVLFTLSLITIFAIFWSNWSQEIIVNEKAYIVSPLEAEEIKLFAVGDIMLDRGVEYMVRRYNGGDFIFPFLNIKKELDNSDILFGNLESVISDKGERVGSIYSFRADIDSVAGLKYAGFDIVSLANNHMFDYQSIALEDTMNILEENSIDYVGAGFNAKEAFSLKTINIKGTKIGFLAYTNLGPVTWRAGVDKTGMAHISKESFSSLRENITEAKEKVDVLIVSLHAGEEYVALPTSFQREFSFLAIDSGADLVIGHHPHVMQGLERYKNGWIAYSLGNFVFDQYFSKETMTAGFLKIVVQNKKLKDIILEHLVINEFYQPSRD